ncbi:alpha/beta hydrolase [Longispora urticae]
MFARKWLLAAGIVAAVLAAGLVVFVLVRPGAAPARPDWAPCAGRDGFDCATLRVPVDHDRPEGPTIGIALNRLPAGDPAARIGALVVNPGGPGESGLDMVFEGREQFAALRGRYDIVGFDPRGVGASGAVRCLDDPAMDQFTAADRTPTTPAGRARVHEDLKAFADACGARSGNLLPFMGTENVARDLDLIRAALGEDRLHYFGFSYGTRLGQFYAERFPGRVGRMVLDSVDNPAEGEVPGPDATASPGPGGSPGPGTPGPGSPGPGTPGPGGSPGPGGGPDPGGPAAAEDEPDQAESVLRDILRDCARRPDCPVGTDENGAVRAVDDLLAKLDTRPLPAAGGRQLTGSLARAALFQATYSPDNWEQARTGLRDALDGRGDGLLALADDYYHRDSQGRYTNATSAFAAVTCLIGDPRQVRGTPGETAARMDAGAAASAKASPHFGAWLYYSSQYCAYWPAAPTVAPHPVSAEGAPTILLVNNTRDAATPLEGAEAVADALADARLVVADADGHIAYGNSPCVGRIVDDFLLNGTVPSTAESWPQRPVTCPA